MLNIRNKEDLNRHFAKGALFENFIINEIFKNQLNRHLTPRNYFWNAASSYEIDLLIEAGGKLIPVEIKSGRTINQHFFDSFKYFQPLSGALPKNSFLVYGGDEVQKRSIANVLSWQHLDKVPL